MMMKMEMILNDREIPRRKKEMKKEKEREKVPISPPCALSNPLRVYL